MSKYEYFVDKESMKEIGRNLWLMRQEKHLLLYQVASKTHIPERIIDRMEIGRNLNYGVLRRLITFYGKRMQIIFE